MSYGWNTTCNYPDVTEWEYLWRRTYWVEASRSGPDHYPTVHYRHVWKPDLENEVAFPDADALNRLGKKGWELVAMAPSPVTLPTTASGTSNVYADFTFYLLMFKRPIP